MVQRIFNKTFTALILTFAYILLLAHNLVPHQHEAETQTPHHHAAATHYHDHEQSNGDGHEDANKPVSDSDPFLSNHQHPFADNKIHHLATQSDIQLLKKQAFPVLVCFLSFNYYLFRLPDKLPDPPAYRFPLINFSTRSHALRGPPVA